MDTSLIKKAGKRRTRRRFSAQFKQQIVMQSMESGASLSALALANGLNSNQVFKWRRDHLEQRGNGRAAVAGLLPVVAMAREGAPLPARVSPPASSHAGHIDITLKHGRIRVEGVVDTDALHMLVQCLRA
jgi:transposase